MDSDTEFSLRMILPPDRMKVIEALVNCGVQFTNFPAIALLMILGHKWAEVRNALGCNGWAWDLSESCLDFVNLDGFDLSDANLLGSSFRNCSLKGASLIGANLIGSDLSFSDMEGAKLDRANLTGVEMDGGSLKDASLVCVKFSGACLWNVILTGADFTGADTSDSSFSDCYGKGLV